MKIIFMGSAAFAVPSLEALVESGHDVELVVTQCDKPAGRGLKVHACPVAAYASSKGIPLFQPLKLKGGAAFKRLAETRPDIIVVVAYGKLIPNNILSIPKISCINVHASLLPKYRGAAPINWAVVNGETRTGVTTIHVNERMDAGDILLQEEVEMGPAETAIELHDRLSIIGANLLIETVEGLKNETIRPAPQDEGLVTYAPILKKEDGAIDWKRSAKQIFDLIRGMQPWPVAYTNIDGKMLKIFMATPHPHPHPPPSRGRELQTIPSPLVGEGVKPRWGHAPLRGRGEGDKYLIERIRTICNDGETEIAVAAERAFLQTIGGDCHTALAAHAVLNAGKVKLTGYLHGSTGRIEGPAREAENLGKQLASKILHHQDTKTPRMGIF